MNASSLPHCILFTNACVKSFGLMARHRPHFPLQTIMLGIFKKLCFSNQSNFNLTQNHLKSIYFKSGRINKINTYNFRNQFFSKVNMTLYYYLLRILLFILTLIGCRRFFFLFEKCTMRLLLNKSDVELIVKFYK